MQKLTGGRSAEMKNGLARSRCLLEGLRGNCGTVLHPYHYFASSVFLLLIAKGFRDFTQGVATVDDRPYFSSLHQIVDEDQVLFVGSGQEGDQLLAGEPRQQKCGEQPAHHAGHGTAGHVANHDVDSFAG